MLFQSIEEVEDILKRWQSILKLSDWDISIYEVQKPWRKTGDIKIDSDDRQAILMLNNYDPKSDDLEALIVHELMHLKLWGLDQTIEQLIDIVFGNNEDDPKREYAMTKFMEVLEPTVEDLTKSLLTLSGKNIRSPKRIQHLVDEEIS